MFELSVACKYLIPRRRQLSVSIISLISVFVIALVVWLIVVFFSVTNGLEKSWIHKLTALTAPVRITPTEAYYNSYYHQIDKISESSDYSSKTIYEKLESPVADPYNPEFDQEIPPTFPSPDRNQDGSLKDPVKLAYSALEQIKDVPGLIGKDFELTATHIRLNLFRNTALYHAHNVYGSSTQSTLEYPAYLGNFEEDNTHFRQTLLRFEPQDFNNFLSLVAIPSSHDSNPNESHKLQFNKEDFTHHLTLFFNTVVIHQLKARLTGWPIPSRLLPIQAKWSAGVILKGDQVIRLIVPMKTNQLSEIIRALEEQGLKIVQGTILIHEGTLTLQRPNALDLLLPSQFALTLAGGSSFNVQLDRESIERARQLDEIRFDADILIQGTKLLGKVNFKGLEIASANIIPHSDEYSPLWVHESKKVNGKPSFILPQDEEMGEGVVLPKSFRDAGVMLGDRGSLSYISPTASVIEEQYVPIYVAGFYDPGIIPIGGKFILANRELTSLIRGSHQKEDASTLTNGINVRFDRLEDANKVKSQLQHAFQKNGISRYWSIETYREYEFTKEIMQELQSQKNLFMLIAIVIIIVACSNIISMLIILVNDKKMEIGILRSMGATSKHIALIFGFAGAIIGVLGSVTGIVAAIFTLRFLDTLIQLLSRLQGHEMFNASIYGQALPSELSMEALTFVLIATICISLLAGIVPAIKACLLRPSQILRSGSG